MANTHHPGTIVKEHCQQRNLTVTAAAKALGVARKTLSELINGKAGISSKMALRLAQAFNTTPEYWLDLQQQCDLQRAKEKTGGFRVSEVAEPYEAKTASEDRPETIKDLLHMVIDALSDEDARKVFDYTRQFQESETLRRLAQDPAIQVPPPGLGGFKVTPPIKGKGKPASELLIEDRRR